MDFSPVTDKELLAQGWAPGLYIFTCRQCKTTGGGDKRSLCCRGCAEVAAFKARQPKTASTEFAELAAKATKGTMKIWGMIVMRDTLGDSNVEHCHTVAATSDPEHGLRTFNANFIAWCFNHRDEIAAALRQAEVEPDALAVAQAIEGPHLPVPEGSKFTLAHLREVRWARLSRQEQGVRLVEAKAAIAAIKALPATAH